MHVIVKWNKKKFNVKFNILIDDEAPWTDYVTLYDLKEKCNELTQVPLNRMKLLFAGATMRDDNAPLSRYGIQDGSTILLLGSAPKAAPPEPKKPSLEEDFNSQDYDYPTDRYGDPYSSGYDNGYGYPQENISPYDNDQQNSFFPGPRPTSPPEGFYPYDDEYGSEEGENLGVPQNDYYDFSPSHPSQNRNGHRNNNRNKNRNSNNKNHSGGGEKGKEETSTNVGNDDESMNSPQSSVSNEKKPLSKDEQAKQAKEQPLLFLDNCITETREDLEPLVNTYSNLVNNHPKGQPMTKELEQTYLKASELLMQKLLLIDLVMAGDNETIRNKRKTAVRLIQELIDKVDEKKTELKAKLS
ncbi:hypothetical protein U3516DRAFT_810949 [Neocallimastix sp. 'constans']